jgi:hypothetical protein
VPLDNEVTVLIPTSPIPRHPKTDLIESCVDSVRRYFPTARVIVMVDGVRPQVAHRREQYAGYKEALAKLANEGKLGRTELCVFSDPSQQAVMTRNVLHHHVTTPLILFVEHDAILRKEPAINFPAIFDLLLNSGVNVVRFYNWVDIYHEHEYLMRGELPYDGARFVKTVQYSQWPLVSRTDYHRELLKRIPVDQKTMIEPAVYYDVARKEWEDNKIVIYLDGERAFTHVDGRADETTGVRDPAEW